MSNPLQLAGKKVGRLTVLSVVRKNSRGQNMWECLCECGSKSVVSATVLNKEEILSCGCLRDELTSIRFSIHKQSYSITYKSWASMKSRCYNTKNNRYSLYGGRGIRVCERWLGKVGFLHFLEDMGMRPTNKHSIDRWPNNDGNYEPGNCRWATEDTQNRNRRSNVWLEYKGEKMVQKDWAKRLRIAPESIKYHLKRGKPFEWVYEYFYNR